MKMQDKIVVVIGSTSGIGKAMAQVFAEEGATSIVTGRRPDRGAEVVDAIIEKGGKAKYYPLDVTKADQVEGVLDAVYTEYGRIDVLLCNAGVAPTVNVHIADATEEVWDLVYDTNIKPTFFMMRKALPMLAESKGSIILTGALAGHSPRTNGGYAYATCKAAIAHMTKLLALEAAKVGVRVNGVSPGLTMTDILSKVSETTIQRLKESIPLRIIGMPEDIAKTALFLASDDARFITGQMICIDGGASIG